MSKGRLEIIFPDPPDNGSLREKSEIARLKLLDVQVAHHSISVQGHRTAKLHLILQRVDSFTINWTRWFTCVDFMFAFISAVFNSLRRVALLNISRMQS